MAKKTFEQNGGYYINGVPYMDCSVTGEQFVMSAQMLYL